MRFGRIIFERRASRPKICEVGGGKWAGSDDHADYRREQITRENARDHGFEAELREIMAALRREGPNSADLDRDAGEIRETA